jgi:hypothetical protein
MHGETVSTACEKCLGISLDCDLCGGMFSLTGRRDVVPIRATVRIDAHAIIAAAVERGAAYGVRRAFKYAADVPDADTIIEHVEREVMNALCDVLKFDDERK